MQLEEKRACPSCGADNPVSSGFCWKCYASFQAPGFQAPGPAAPPAPGLAPNGQARTLAPRPGMAPPGPPPVPTTAPARGSGISVIVRLVVGALAAAAGYFGVQTLLGGSVELPDTVAGRSRMTNPMARGFEDSTIEEAEKWGLDAKAGVYGGVEPEVFVILIDDSAIETTDQLFDSLIEGMAQAGATVHEGDVLSGQHDEAEYRCVGVSGNGVEASACMWRSEDNVGIVLDVTRGLDQIEPVLFEVHDAAVS